MPDTQIPAEHLEKWRHLIEPEISSGITSMAWDKFLQMQIQLFEAASSVVVTRDVVLEGRAARSIWVAGGVLGEVLDLVRKFEKSAVNDGLRRVVFMGRRGWIRAAEGYREAATVGAKEL